MANDVAKGVYSILNGESSITDDTSSRIRPIRLNQNETLPAIAYQIVSQNSDQHLGDISGLALSRVQIDCYADDHIKAAELGNDVRLALKFYQGTPNGETFRRVLPSDARTRYEEPVDSSDAGRYVHSRDYLIWHTETTS